MEPNKPFLPPTDPIPPDTEEGTESPGPESFPKGLHIIPFLPFACVLLEISFQLFIPVLGGLIQLIGYAVIIALFIAYSSQRKFLRARGEHDNALAIQNGLLLTSTIVPCLGGIAGHIVGSIDFGNGTDQINLFFVPVFAFVSGFIVLDLCAIANIFLICNTRPHTVFRVLGAVGRVVAYGCIAAVTYFAYTALYSLRDPSTE